jgi:hypothetical protein
MSQHDSLREREEQHRPKNDKSKIDDKDVYKSMDMVMKYLHEKRKDLPIKEFNIYKLIMKFLEDNKFTNKIFEMEKQKGTRYANDVITKTLGVGTDYDEIVNVIKSNIKPGEIILLTGIGNCFSIVRGHSILNNLQSAITENPLIMFYPGVYSGQSFKLFNKLEPDNYYRAFQLIDRK